MTKSVMNVPKNPTVKEYVRQKGVFNCGIPAGILCLIIYFFLKGDPVPFVGVAGDLMIAVFVTVLICALTGIPGIKADIRNGKAPRTPIAKFEHPVYSHIANGMFMQCVGFAVLSTMIFAMIPGGICAAIATFSGNPELAINPTLYWILKSLYSGFFVSKAMGWVTYCTVAQYQDELGPVVY